MFWNEDNYDVSKNRYMRQAYEAKKWGFVPDYARLDIVNTYGGVYLDTDVELLRPLEDLLKYRMFCGFQDVNHVNFGLGFGAQKGHEILVDMMQEYDEMEFYREDGTLNMVASPVYQTKTLEKYGLVKNGCTQISDSYIALAMEYLSPINEFGIGMPTARSYSIHQYAATWFDEEQIAERERMISNYKMVLARMESE